MIKPKYGDQIGKWFINNKLEIVYISDCWWTTYVIIVNITQKTTNDRAKKTSILPPTYRELPAPGWAK